MPKTKPTVTGGGDASIALCSDCGRTANNMTCIRKYGQVAKQEAFTVSTFHTGECYCCGQTKLVTEERDFFYPDVAAINYLKRYLHTGEQA